jgi:hypothetical protein
MINAFGVEHEVIKASQPPGADRWVKGARRLADGKVVQPKTKKVIPEKIPDVVAESAQRKKDGVQMKLPGL